MLHIGLTQIYYVIVIPIDYRNWLLIALIILKTMLIVLTH